MNAGDFSGFISCIGTFTTKRNEWLLQTGGGVFIFQSEHGKGLSNILMGDGSAKTFNIKGMDVNTYFNLCDRNDGNVVGEF